jgi:hypothetical protein
MGVPWHDAIVDTVSHMAANVTRRVCDTELNFMCLSLEPEFSKLLHASGAIWNL